MNTLKTGVVVVVLLAVLYGVYVVLNNPQNQHAAGVGEESEWQTAATTDAPMVSLGPPTTAPPEMDWSGSSDRNSQTTAPSMAAGDAGSFANAPSSASDQTPVYHGIDQGHDHSNDHAVDHPTNQLGGDLGAPSGSVRGLSTPPGQGSNIPGDGKANGNIIPQGGFDGAAAQGSSFGVEAVSRAGEATGGGSSVDASPSSATMELGRRAFDQSWTTALDHVKQGEFRQALALLTPFYGSPDLDEAEQSRLLELLDPLAGKVIYSTEHRLLDPYAARRGETLQDVAQQFNVPWRLLQNINGVRDPQVLIPGTKLKVVRGPFHAQVRLADSQLTLFVENYYAGRFDLEMMRADSIQPGQYRVIRKIEWPEYDTQTGRRLPARNPLNPYGRWLIDLGGGVSLHSSSAEGESAKLGSISLSPQDAADVFSILSEGSPVEIR